MVYLIIVLFGLVIGSFLNVCIYRIPRGESVVFPRSHCPKCGHKIPWHENVPVLSFILLGGKCSRCKQGISSVYPVVEIITALIAVLLYKFFGFSFETLIFFILFSALVIATFVDFERQEIPDVITLPGILIGLVLSCIYPDFLGETRPLALLNSFLGVLAGGGSLYLVGFLGELVFRKEAMGGGDVKLLAMVGAFLGWKLALLAFFIAPLFGSFVGIALKMKEGKEMIPYGPYLSLASFIALLWGNDIMNFLFNV